MQNRITIALMFNAILFCSHLAGQTDTSGATDYLGDFRILSDLETTQNIQPLEEIEWTNPDSSHDNSLGHERTFLHHYGFDRYDDPTYELKSGENPDAVAQQRWPHPRLTVLQKYPKPVTQGYIPYGILAVDGIRIWKRAKESAADTASVREKRVWRWQIPKEKEESRFYLSPNLYRERFASLCLIPHDVKDTTLYNFEMESGLRWQAQVPLYEAIHEGEKRLGLKVDATRLLNGEAVSDVKTISTQDGSRTLVSVCVNEAGEHDLRCIFLFIYDEKGALLRTRIFPNRIFWGTLQGENTKGFGRTPTTDQFEFTFIWTPSESEKKQHSMKNNFTMESFLLDASGNIQGRFVGTDGRPSDIGFLSDTYALVTRPQADGTQHRLLYRLPSPGVSNKSVSPDMQK